MVLTLQRLEIADPDWLRFIESCSSVTAFHHPAWAELLSACYGFRPFAFVLEDGGRIRAGLPFVEVGNRLTGRRWVSLPFTDYCPPLAESEAALIALTDALVEQRQRNGIEAIEVRAPLLEREGVYTYSDAVRHVLSLSEGCNTVYARFSKMHQRNIRKSEYCGVWIKQDSSLSAIRELYRLHIKTRQRLGTPVQPFRFFDLLAQHLVEDNLGFVLLACLDDRPIAATVFLAWNGTIIYKYGASDRRFWKYRPNNLLFWTAIKWGCEHGYHTFDFGRTDLSDEGLRAFKNGWGTKEEPLVYSVIANRPPRPSSGRIKKAMGAVIRRSPVWVCRLIGELFYKYAA